jgi:phage FluMu gp28-like protein
MAAEAPVLYPYQQRYLRDGARWKAACWSRQTGKTFTTTLEAVLDALQAEAEGRLARWTILSISRDRALDAMETGVKLHLRAIGAAYEELTDASLGAEELAAMVRLPGGSYIRAIASRPETARGMSDNLILDEFAHHQDNRAVWRALVPVVSRPGLRLRVISTPNGAGDMFHEIMETGLDGLFSRHVVTIHDAVADGLPRDIEELRRAAHDPDTFAQEYECAFLDRSSRHWLALEDLLACRLERPLPQYGGAPCYVGMDIAARADLTVIAVLEETGDVLAVRELAALRRASFGAQLAELDRIMRQYRVVRVAMDQTGMGEMPVEEARRRHGGYRVEGVLFTASRRLDLAVALRDRFERRRIRIPHDTELMADLRSVRAEPGLAGVPRLIAEREAGSHADRFWALALACAAAATERPDYSLIEPAGHAAAVARLARYEPARRGWGAVRRVANGY